jgi:nucleoporin SEH1
MMDDPDGTAMVLTGNSPQTISSEHSDFILSTALDVYGRRLATCSGDRQIKIWESNGATWKLTASWQAHRSAVTSVAWAHPEYGILLASGSSDHSCKVWQEDSSSSTTPVKHHHGTSATSTAANPSSSSTPAQSTTTTTTTTTTMGSPYVAKATLTESPRPVSCVQFAPRHWGLKLATGSADGTLRIYEAVDVCNVSQWPIAASLESSTKDGITCLSWCTGRFDPPTIAVGSAGGAIIYRYADAQRSWAAILHLETGKNVLSIAWAPNVGRRFHWLAAASDTDGLVIYKLKRGKVELLVEAVQDDIKEAVWQCRWNATGTVLTTAGDMGLLRIWKTDAVGKFVNVAHIPGKLRS